MPMVILNCPVWLFRLSRWITSGRFPRQQQSSTQKPKQSSKRSVELLLLTDVIGRYLDTLSEREFDAPFLSILRQEGFSDIHFLHGSFEFGKDFIAKKIVNGRTTQYLFQTKAGDINLGAWSAIRGQIDMLRTNIIAHPNFDETADRRACLVITGRLIGASAAAAQDYHSYLEKRNELSFDVWDREGLIGIFTNCVVLGATSAGLFQLLGTSDIELTFAKMEEYSRSWMRDSTENFVSDLLEATLICHHCAKCNRDDLACFVAQMYVRGALFTFDGEQPDNDDLKFACKNGLKLFDIYASKLLVQGLSVDIPNETIKKIQFPSFTAYPVFCCLYAELLSFLALYCESESPQRAKEIAEHLRDFVQKNPGVCHPVSDHYCSSLVVTGITLYKFGFQNAFEQFITDAASWIADHYEPTSMGLAPPHSSAEDEVEQLLGAFFEDSEIEKRNDSFLASALLDVCAATESKHLYQLCINEFLAVETVLPVLEGDKRAIYGSHLAGSTLEPNMLYAGYWIDHSWCQAPHHHREEMQFPELVGGSLLMLLVSMVVRDRFFPASLHRLVTPSL